MRSKEGHRVSSNKPFISSETERQINLLEGMEESSVTLTRGKHFLAPNIWLLAISQFRSMYKLCYWVYLEPCQSRRASIRLRSWYDSWDPFHHWDNHDYFRDPLQGGFDVGEQQKNTEPGNAVWASAFINKRPEQPCLQRPYFDPGGNIFLSVFYGLTLLDITARVRSKGRNAKKLHFKALNHSIIFLGKMQTKFYCQNIGIIVIFDKKMFKFLCHMIGWV